MARTQVKSHKKITFKQAWAELQKKINNIHNFWYQRTTMYYYKATTNLRKEIWHINTRTDDIRCKEERRPIDNRLS